MRTIFSLAFLPLLLLLFACNGEQSGDPDLPQEYADAVEEYVTQDSARHITDHNQIRQALLDFYGDRGYRIAWVDEDDPDPRADTLLTLLETAEATGPSHSSYDLDRLHQQLQETYDGDPSPSDLARLDAEFTLAYMRHTLDLHSGRLDPGSNDRGWDADRDELDLAQHLHEALRENQIEPALADVTPRHEGYSSLREALGTYREIAAEGGWPEVPAGAELARGDTSSSLPVLRERLRATGDLPADTASEPTTFDDELAEGLASFQERVGLEVDSTLNDRTRAELNVPVEDRLRLIEINLERWHWLPADLGERYIVVNLPAYELRVYDNGEQVDEMAVVIGEEYEDQATPTFIDQMEHLIFDPYWNIPRSIAKDEILPHARDDLDYLARNNYEIVDRYGPEGNTIEPEEDLLDEIEEGNLFLREEPGPDNPLGRVKFMFPNEYAVYLHDTPEEHLFDLDERGFSHGCVRVERPADLAEFVLQENEGWDRDRIETAMSDGEWEQVMLEEQVPVYLLYWTAYADPDTGQVHFRDDIYSHDDDLADALQPAD